MKLLTHLNFPGNCAQAFHYYEDNLGGTHPTSPAFSAALKHYLKKLLLFL
jgi:uncharacterized glyoxalase superfamily protein PhnB